MWADRDGAAEAAARHRLVVECALVRALFDLHVRSCELVCRHTRSWYGTGNGANIDDISIAEPTAALKKGEGEGVRTRSAAA